MAEYIKREVAYNILCDGCNACNGNHEICDEYRMISGIPAADVRENVRCVWKLIPTNISIAQVSMVVECSKCGVRRDRLIGDVLNYCPNCGADMRV